MQTILTKQIVPISDFRLHQGETLAKMNNGPVYLAQRSKPVAVLISANQWDAVLERLEILEQERLDFRSMELYREMLTDPSSAVHENEYQQLLDDAGLDE